MINSSTKFYFDNKWSDDASLPSIINATLESDLYSFNVIGEKTIVEDQIQGRDEPYLYNVDFKPLEFTINIAFQNYETIDEVTKVITWLYNPKTYKRLKFEDMDTNFFVIFIGSPEYYYVGRNDLGYQKYIGYITCKVRANAPYGYTDLIQTTTNSGDLDTYPSFKIVNTYAGANTVTITHDDNNSSFTYVLSQGETLDFNGYTKVLISSGLNPAKNPYASWGKDYLIFNPGDNDLTVEGLGQTITYSYRAPKYL